LGRPSQLIAVVVLWPVVVMFRTSVQHFSPNGFLLGPAGSKNFKNLFDEPDLPGILWRTAIWVVVVGVCHDGSLPGVGPAVQPGIPGTAGDPMGVDRSVGGVGVDDDTDIPVGA
jgi:hypothetical protein